MPSRGSNRIPWVGAWAKPEVRDGLNGWGAIKIAAERDSGDNLMKGLKNRLEDRANSEGQAEAWP